MKQNLIIISAASFLALGGLAIANTSETLGSSDCTITHSNNGNSVKLESWFDGDGSGAGTYEVRLKSTSGPNRVNSRQGGKFIKHAGKAVLLGKAHLSARGQAYHVKLNVSFKGKTHSCEATIDAST